MMAPAGAGKDELLKLAYANPEVAALVAGKSIVKEVAVPGRLVAIVVK